MKKLIFAAALLLSLSTAAGQASADPGAVDPNGISWESTGPMPTEGISWE